MNAWSSSFLLAQFRTKPPLTCFQAKNSFSLRRWTRGARSRIMRWVECWDKSNKRSRCQHQSRNKNALSISQAAVKQMHFTGLSAFHRNTRPLLHAFPGSIFPIVFDGNWIHFNLERQEWVKAASKLREVLKLQNVSNKDVAHSGSSYFVLWKAASQTKYSCSPKVKQFAPQIFSPPKFSPLQNFRLATSLNNWFICHAIQARFFKTK